MKLFGFVYLTNLTFTALFFKNSVFIDISENYKFNVTIKSITIENCLLDSFMKIKNTKNLLLNNFTLYNVQSSKKNK